MELVTASDLFVTASLALLLSFLIAKLVSLAMAGDPHTHTSTRRLTVQSQQSESKVGFLSPIQVATNVEIEHHNREEVTVEPSVVELPVKSDIAVELSNVDGLTEESAEEKIGEARVLIEETGTVGVASHDDSAEQGNTERVEEISVEPSTEMKISVVEGEVKGRDEDDDDDDDDWEGIERSELEKVFMAAAEFVVGNGCGGEDDRVACIGSDVQMELYGLHKVATEGPCREPQPMPLKLSARAKWNAWQKLGNMSPEVAMEQYVALVSDKVPGWMKDTSAGMREHETTVSEVSESAAPDLSTSFSHQPMIVTERELEQESGAQDRSPLTESDLENNVKK